MDTGSYTDWWVARIRPSIEGPFLRVYKYKEYEGWVRFWDRLDADSGIIDPVWSNQHPQSDYDMMDVSPLDSWAVFGIGTFYDYPTGSFQEWTTWTVSGGL